MKSKKFLSLIMALFFILTNIVSTKNLSKAQETHNINVVTWNKKTKKSESTVGELTFEIKTGYPLKKVGEFTSKNGKAEIPELKDGNYSICLKENKYYTVNDIFLTVEGGIYTFDGEDEENTITVEKKEGVEIPSPTPTESMQKSLLVYDGKNIIKDNVLFDVFCDGQKSTVTVDNNGAIDLEVFENKTYTIKLISNEKYEMKDITFTCKKEINFLGITVPKLVDENGRTIETLTLTKKNNYKPVEKEFVFDVLCGSCGKTPIEKELSFEVIGKDSKKIYTSNSGIVKFRLLENEKYKVKLVEDKEYELTDIEIEVKKENGKLFVYTNDGKIIEEFVMKKKSNTGNCVDSLCDFSDKKVKMKEIPIKVSENGVLRDLKSDEEIIFNLYNASKAERVGEVKTVNGKLPALEVLEKDDYILSTSKKNKKFIVADTPFVKEVSELYFMSRGEGKFPIRHKNKNPYATGANLNIEQVVVRPLKSNEKIKEKYTIDYIRIRQDKNNPQDYSKVKIIFTSEYDTVVATTLPEDKWGVPLTPIELYENVQYSVRVEDPDNKFAIENFPLTLVDKSERGPNHPKKWGDGKYVFNHAFCGNATWIDLVKKGTENDKNTTITCSNGNTTITGMNFRDLMLKTIRPDKSLVKGLEGKDFDLFRFKLINPKRCEVSKMADGDFVIHRTVKDGKIAKKVYQVNKDGSLTELTFKQTGNVVDINTKTLSIYDTIIEYEDKLDPADKIELQKAIDKAKNPETTKGKTEESVEAMNKALKKAEEILVKADATQEEVNKAEEELTASINALKDKPNLPKVEKVELKNEDGSIVVTGDTNTLNKDWKVLTKGVNPSELVGKEYDAYDINLKDANNGETQPRGEVTVTIKVKSKVEKLYHIDGGLKEIPFTYENGKITFKTNHFSVYAVVYGDKKDDNKKPGEDGKPGNDNNKSGKDVGKNKNSMKKNKLPRTNISGGLSYAITSILALGVAGAVGYKKKH